MESDKKYFLEGLFVIVLSVALALFFVWLGRTGNKDDELYRIYFQESVSGLNLGDPVKYLGVDIGLVDALTIDPEDPGQVQVDVKLRKGAPIKSDTRATLQFKGITGAYFIELKGSTVDAKTLLSVTEPGEIPEIESKKSTFNTLMEELPRVVAKFSAIEDQTKKVVSDISAVTAKVKENPSVLLRRPKKNRDTNRK
ncbi:MAG: MlaD family protein [Gammaproteobacteria bacterium]|nr:MlaD family protein [Gammaproteobacteria bacterium]